MRLIDTVCDHRIVVQENALNDVVASLINGEAADALLGELGTGHDVQAKLI